MPSSEAPPSTEAHAERFELGTLWEVVRDCRDHLAKSFGYLDREAGDALALAVSELAENVIKYAEPESLERPSVMVRVAAERILVRSENAVRSHYDARLACRLVAQVAAEVAGGDSEQAYAAAIERTLGRSTSHSRQGFYRIAAIGGFQLRAELEGKKLTIIGERTR